MGELIRCRVAPLLDQGGPAARHRRPGAAAGSALGDAPPAARRAGQGTGVRQINTTRRNAAQYSTQPPSSAPVAQLGGHRVKGGPSRPSRPGADPLPGTRSQGIRAYEGGRENWMIRQSRSGRQEPHALLADQ